MDLYLESFAVPALIEDVVAVVQPLVEQKRQHAWWWSARTTSARCTPT